MNHDALVGGVLQSSEIPPGLTLLKRAKPWGLFLVELASVFINILQLLGFAFGQDTPKPPIVQRPAAALQRVQDLGVYVNDAEIFWMAVGSTTMFVASMLAQEKVEEAAWLSGSSFWKAVFTAMSAYVRVCAGPGYLLLLKILVFRVVYLLAKGNAQMNCYADLSVATILVLFLVVFTFRLARVDYELKDLEVNLWRFFDCSLDRTRTPADRQRIHFLSTRDPKYDTVIVVIKTFLLLNALIIANRDFIVVAGVIRVLASMVLLAVGVTYEQYFPPCPGQPNMNRMQTALDAGMLWAYAASLLAGAMGEEAAQSTWFTFVLGACSIMAVAGYMLRPYAKACISRSLQRATAADTENAPLLHLCVEE